MGKTITVLYVPADESRPVETKEISGDLLREVQRMVDGYVEQVTFSANVVGLFNVDGPNLALPLNRRATVYLQRAFGWTNSGFGAVGNVVFAASDAMTWSDVDEAVIEWFKTTGSL